MTNLPETSCWATLNELRYSVKENIYRVRCFVINHVKATLFSVNYTVRDLEITNVASMSCSFFFTRGRGGEDAYISFIACIAMAVPKAMVYQPFCSEKGYRYRF